MLAEVRAGAIRGDMRKGISARLGCMPGLLPVMHKHSADADGWLESSRQNSVQKIFPSDEFHCLSIRREVLGIALQLFMVVLYILSSGRSFQVQ